MRKKKKKKKQQQQQQQQWKDHQIRMKLKRSQKHKKW
jgi:hypothetical protein